ncbi:hypothetical protein ANN_15205 [Periplaneta americana]|uniref:Uncharacterized protein n=1 Tax=Periplaneta americana TaxID=6978 RepID=A0ABQ8SG11_PERAM|nr:hypothetical protein ANN_15205 [Periplaneta americana]
MWQYSCIFSTQSKDFSVQRTKKNGSGSEIESNDESVFTKASETRKASDKAKKELYTRKKKKVIEFIKKLEATESHYSRNKSQRLYLKASRHISEVVVHFPVRGHSFLPADRLFGVVEKTLWKKAKIINPNDYRTVYETMDSVKNLGEIWTIRDYKSLASQCKKVDRIKDMKRVMLKRIYKNGKSEVSLKMVSTFRCDKPFKVGTHIIKRGIRRITEPQIKETFRLLTDTKKNNEDTLL